MLTPSNLVPEQLAVGSRQCVPDRLHVSDAKVYPFVVREMIAPPSRLSSIVAVGTGAVTAADSKVHEGVGVVEVFAPDGAAGEAAG